MDTNLSRRHALVGAMSATLVGTVAIAAVVPPEEHPDAALFAAWAGYKAVYAQWRAFPEAETIEECDRKTAWFEAAIIVHEGVLRMTDAKTLAGLAIRMSYLCCEGQSALEVQDHFFHGAVLPDKVLERADYVDELMLRFTQNIRALAV
jgi:hypothetical protein